MEGFEDLGVEVGSWYGIFDCGDILPSRDGENAQLVIEE